MAANRSTLARPAPSANDKRKSLIVSTAIAVAALLCGVVGYGLYDLTHKAKAVRIDRTFTGAVSFVGNSGASGCVQPNGGGKPICTDLYPIGGRILRVGDKVRAAHEKSEFGDLLLVYG